ncbi:MAG TPA: septum site-determining protein MinC [Phenylobacterium sp.]|nr:septum site-determining protein MinC [Phenylobacterium sp.]
MSTETLPLPHITLRGRTFMALVVSPEYPMANWFAALDHQMLGAAGFFVDRPIVANLATTLEEGGPEAVHIVLEGLEARELRLVGIEGVDPVLLAGTRWERLPKTLHGRAQTLEAWAGMSSASASGDEPPALGSDIAQAATGAPSLLIDRPVRSGQSILFEDGDVTIVGPVASGAEVIAGGSIHVYGTLRGRAIAGLRTGAAARIFCRKMEAELVGVDRLYRTAEHWGESLHGRSVQVMCDRGALRLSAFD